MSIHTNLLWKKFPDLLVTEFDVEWQQKLSTLKAI